MSSHLHNCIVYIDAIKKGENVMKTTEELNALKEEVKALNKKLAELTEEELVQVIGGGWVYQDIEISLESENGEGEKS